MNRRTAAIAACGLLLLLLAAGRCSTEVRLIADPEAAARGELIRAAAAATGTAIAAHAAVEPMIAAANAQAIATKSANAAIVDDARTRERLEVSARWTTLQQAALTIGNYALLAIISAEDENGDSEYLAEDEFVGTYTEACKAADALADEWERKTGRLILRLVLESRGTRPDRAGKAPR